MTRREAMYAILEESDPQEAKLKKLLSSLKLKVSDELTLSKGRHPDAYENNKDVEVEATLFGLKKLVKGKNGQWVATMNYSLDLLDDDELDPLITRHATKLLNQKLKQALAPLDPDEYSLDLGAYATIEVWLP